MTKRAYRTETRKYKVGCGELRVRIAFKGDESFHFLLVDMDNQDNECGCCFLNVVQNGLTMLLRRIKEEEIDDVIKNLKGQRCKKDFELNNCPNAIGSALKDVFINEVSTKRTV